MAHDEVSGTDSAASGSSAVETSHRTSAGTAVIGSDVENPGEPPHRERVTDLDPAKAKHADRTVYTLFYLSIAGSVFALAAYMAFPIEDGDPVALRLNTLFIGLGSALALFGIGLAAVHWGKALMYDKEGIDLRHPLIAFPLPGLVLFRGLGPQDQDPVELLNHTMWKKGSRLTLDPSGIPVKASDVTIGSVFHIIPEGLNEREDLLEQKAKAAVLLMRLDPGDLNISPEREGWSYDGIVAYSKICTHVGCPVALYEQQTHHLLCPCHQSTFDVVNEAKVIFGPAKRPLPQLPIEVDSEGYLVAQSDFHEPVGPSFWERS
jgi:ubiquinol-cytochrome c reductase iron-sulfur subunit